MQKIIGVNEFNRSKFKIALFLVLIAGFIAFLLYISFLTGFELSSLLLVFVLGGGILFLFRNIFKPNLYITDDCITTRNEFGTVRRFEWNQIETVDFAYVQIAKDTPRCFVLYVTDPVNHYPAAFNIVAADYSEEDIQKIAQLFFTKLGKNKLSETMQEMVL